MKKVFCFLAVAVIAFFTVNCGGGGNTPAGIEKSILTQMQKGNYDKAIEIMMAHLDATAEQKAQLAAFINSEKLKAEAEKKGGIASFEVIKEEISEDGLTATVETKTVYKDGKEKTDTNKYVKKDGKWLLSIAK